MARDIIHSSGKSWNTNYNVRWSQRFIKRHGFSLRTPNFVSSQSLSVSEEILSDYLSLLQNTLSSIDFISKPELIINMNETGWGKGPQFKHKIVMEKGKKT